MSRFKVRLSGHNGFEQCQASPSWHLILSYRSCRTELWKPLLRKPRLHAEFGINNFSVHTLNLQSVNSTP
jgi:hypothetical protein